MFTVHGRASQDYGGNHSQGGVGGPIGGRIESAVFITEWVVMSYGAFTPVVPEDSQRIPHSLRWQRKCKCLAMVARFIRRGDYMLGS